MLQYSWFVSNSSKPYNVLESDVLGLLELRSKSSESSHGRGWVVPKAKIETGIVATMAFKLAVALLFALNGVNAFIPGASTQTKGKGEM